MTAFVLRPATAEDVDALQAIRRSVRENRLSDPARVTRADYLRFLERDGRTFVAVAHGRVVGFAAGDRTRANVWALFVDPAHERRGVGRALLDALVRWFLEVEGLPHVWLTTEPGTRAERFYRAAGWIDRGIGADGERRFEFAARSD